MFFFIILKVTEDIGTDQLVRGDPIWTKMSRIRNNGASKCSFEKPRVYGVYKKTLKIED
jgi:hypothetical protein